MPGNRFLPTAAFTLAAEDGGSAARKEIREVSPQGRTAAAASAAGNTERHDGTAAGAASNEAPRSETSEALESGRTGQEKSEGERQGTSSTSGSSRFPETWRSDLAAGDKTFLKMLDRFDSPVALAKAYRELTSKLSSGEIKMMKPPTADATPDQIAAWRAEHGLPENAEAYVQGLRLADGTVTGAAEQPLLAAFAEQAMKSNWTGEQFNQAVGWYFALQDRLLAGRQIQDAELKEKATRDLMREWGSDYTANRNAVAQFLDRSFPHQFKIDLLNARLPDGRALANDPSFVRAILELAKTVNPAGPLLPNASGASLSSAESRIAEIEAKYMRAAYGSDSWKTYWSGESGTRMQQEYRGLLAAREQVRRERA
jgi:hypothetical protein